VSNCAELTGRLAKPVPAEALVAAVGAALAVDPSP
jgi:hypothetical protein